MFPWDKTNKATYPHEPPFQKSWIRLWTLYPYAKILKYLFKNIFKKGKIITKTKT